MKRSLLSILATLIFGLGISFAQGPQMGTWKLNESKSKIPAGTTKNTTVVYAAEGDKVKVTTDGTGPDGKPAHSEWTGKFDGKDYPVTGDPSGDSRSYRKLNDSTLMLSSKKQGKVTVDGEIMVSKDGKTRTVRLSGMDAAGKKVSSFAVYDKQ